jgi:hypothetical protein
MERVADVKMKGKSDEVTGEREEKGTRSRRIGGATHER